MRRLPEILLALLLTICLAGFVKAQEGEEPALIPPDATILADMYARINTLRERYGRPAYRLNDSLNRAAQSQAEYLVTTGRRGHFRADGSRPSTRAAAFGFVSSHWCCGENYYMSIDATPDMVYDFWRWSPGHFVNLVHRDFTDIGLGMSSDGYRISYVTLFGEADDLHPPDADPPQNSTATEQAEAPNPEMVPTSELASPENASSTLTGTGGEYIVRPGDTLGRIAARYQTTVQLLVTTNHLSNPEIIYPGQHLILPDVAPQPAGESQPANAPSEPQTDATPSTIQRYVVEEGETLARIAARYGTTVQAIVALNNIVDPSLIYAGQVLNIPVDQ